MNAKNRVLAGDYVGSLVSQALGQPYIGIGIGKSVYINRSTVESYEVITDEHRKSAASGIARGLVAGALLGSVGLLAGGLSAKTKGIYQIAVQFKDGKRSLIEVDDKVYKAIIKSCF